MQALNRALTSSSAFLVLVLAACGVTDSANETPHTQNRAGVVGFQLIRNATVKIDYAGTTFLVDPMLADKGAWPGFPGTYNSHLRNPLVELPVPLSAVMDADAVIVTHTHPDHWDDAAAGQLPKSMPVFVQDEQDAAAIEEHGFVDVRVLGKNTAINGTRLLRIGGQHGTDSHMSEFGHLLGSVSGVMFKHPGHATLYIAGDTVWRPEVEAAIQKHRPDVIVLNTGYARITGFDGSIIMGKEDLVRARKIAPNAVLISVHMEAVNHVGQSRADLIQYIEEHNLDATRTLVPSDQESYRF